MLDGDLVGDTLAVRPLRHDDRVEVPGGTPLVDVMASAGVDRADRDSWPVVVRRRPRFGSHGSGHRAGSGAVDDPLPLAGGATRGAMEVGKVLISAAEIETKINEMGRQITEDYQGRDSLVVAVLKGAFIVMADLARAIDLPCSSTSWPCPLTGRQHRPRASSGY